MRWLVAPVLLLGSLPCCVEEVDTATIDSAPSPDGSGAEASDGAGLQEPADAGPSDAAPLVDADIPAWQAECLRDPRIEHPECCSTEDRQPCRGLPESECAVRDYCWPVMGEPYPWAPNAPVPPLSFVGCVSICPDAQGGASHVCAYDTANPDVCACLPSRIFPDGFEELPGGFECTCDPPPGFCGQ